MFLKKGTAVETASTFSESIETVEKRVLATTRKA
jgi:hypothetical protein